MDGVTLVRVDTTVGTERATTGLGSLLDDNVADDELLNVKALGLSVGLSVLKEGKEELDRLDGPSTCEIEEWRPMDRARSAIALRVGDMIRVSQQWLLHLRLLRFRSLLTSDLHED